MNHFFDHERGDNITGGLFGVAGGLLAHFHQLNTAVKLPLLQIEWMKDTETILVAIICGGAGVLGKHIVTLILRKFKPSKNKNATD